MAVDETVAFLETVYDRHKSLLLSVIRRYLGQSDGCEDVFQDVFVKIIRRSQQLRELPPEKLETYLILMARGTAIDHLRKRKLQPHSSDESILQLLNSRARPSSAGGHLLKADLGLMLADIPKEQQILLIGKYYLGLSTHDLASITNSTAAGVKMQLQRARKKLLTQWKRSGLNLGDFINET